MGDVLRLVPESVGDGVTLDADQILEAAKGEFTQLVLVGVKADGEYQVRGTHSAPEAVMALEWGKLYLVQNLTDRT